MIQRKKDKWHVSEIRRRNDVLECSVDPSIKSERPPGLDAAERNQLSMLWSSIFAHFLHFSFRSSCFLSAPAGEPTACSAFLDVVDLSEVPVGQGRAEIHSQKVNASELK